jgi:hypothetical protein
MRDGGIIHFRHQLQQKARWRILSQTRYIALHYTASGSVLNFLQYSNSRSPTALKAWKSPRLKICVRELGYALCISPSGHLCINSRAL